MNQYYMETGNDEVKRDEIVSICRKNDLNVPQWFLNEEKNRVGRGKYKLPVSVKNIKKDFVQENTIMNAQIMSIKNAPFITTLKTDSTVPDVYNNYVPFGNYNDLNKIISSKKFYPVFITGHSGNGKTMMVEQICAKSKRKFVCVSMTEDTDESDLLGNYVLINNEMVWRDGPVTVAAKTGAVLCIDEVDYGARNLSSLQRVLEGKPFLLKKKNEVVVPLDGFTIIATANTKGKGSDDGRYIFTNILNEAFLERFPITMEQEWASVSIEKKILKNELESDGAFDKQTECFVDNLTKWAEVIRKTFDEDGCNEVISTRRLVQIIKAYIIFKDEIKSIEYCLNRFDKDTKASFIDLYTKINENVNVENSMKDSTTDQNVFDLNVANSHNNANTNTSQTNSSSTTSSQNLSEDITF